jgi:hypothetical protein
MGAATDLRMRRMLRLCEVSTRYSRDADLVRNGWASSADLLVE